MNPVRRLALGLLVACAVNAHAQEPIVIKFSHVVADTTPKGKAALMFAKLAEEKTHGRVKVQVYSNSTLYKDNEEMEALQLGSVQMLAPSASKFGALGITAFEVFDLPYIFPDRKVLRKVTEGKVGQGLLKLLEPKGIQGLAFWDNGFKQMSANTPLHMPGDFKGLKMRIKPSKVLDAQMRALGANPQVMAFSAVYQALQTGVVDGAENTLPNIYSKKFYEVQKYIALSNHGYDGYVVIANKKFWSSLPADIRSELEQALKEATAQEIEQTAQEEQALIRKIKAAGKADVYALTPEETAAWRKALAPVQKEMAGRVGKKWIDGINQEAAALGY